MEKELKNKILDEIKDKDISPKPKWQFLLKDYFVWGLGGLSVFVGGIAFSLIIFVFMNSDWESYRYLSDGFFEHLVKMAPYLWIVVLGGFILVADYNFSHTKKGYKYSVPKITGLSILASILLGVIFYQIGLAHIADYELGKRIPGYQRFTEKRQELWNNPEEGLLSGNLVLSERSDVLVLKDFEGKEWDVEVSRLNPMDFIILDEAETIVLVGYAKDKNTFDACLVRPWKTEGESLFLREKIMKRALEEGVDSPTPLGMGSGSFERMRMRFQEDNISERNIFRMRNNECERGTTSPRAQI